MKNLKRREYLFWIGFISCNAGWFLLLRSIESYPESEWTPGLLFLGLGCLLWIIYLFFPDFVNVSNASSSATRNEVKPSDHRINAFKEAAIFWMIFFGVFVGLLFVYRLDEIKLFTDTRYYAGVASKPLVSADFWFAERPVGLPLLYKLIGITRESIAERTYLSFAHRLTQLQLLFSLLAFTFLGVAVARLMKNRVLRILSFTLVMLLGLGIDVSQWNKALLTESLATSTFIFLIGLWVFGIELWSRWENANKIVKTLYSVTLFLVSAIYLSLRDTHSYFLLIIAVAIFISLAVISPRKRGKVYLLIGYGIFLLGIVFLQNYSAERGERWLGPYSHVLYLRLLRDERSTNYLLESGMPSENLAEEYFQGRRRDFERMLAEDPSGQPILDWMRENGRGVYYRFLIQNPWYFIGEPLQDLSKLVSPDSSEYRERFYPEPVWIDATRNVLYPESLALLALWLLLLLIGIGWLISKKRIGRQLIIPLFLLISFVPMMLIVWHGDAIEVERHAQQVHLQLRLGLWIVTLIIIDRLISTRLPSKVDIQ